MSRGMIPPTLDGTKTQTRRVVRPQPPDLPGWWKRLHWASEQHFRKGGIHHCPYGVPGDRLWVRETWCNGTPKPFYRADGDFEPKGFIRWRPSIHMPRGASRITLEIRELWVERVQEITPEDCEAEGIAIDYDYPLVGPCGADEQLRASEPFAELWDSLNARRGYGWDVNPWVWVIVFRRMGAGPDQKTADSGA